MRYYFFIKKRAARKVSDVRKSFLGYNSVIFESFYFCDYFWLRFLTISRETKYWAHSLICREEWQVNISLWSRGAITMKYYTPRIRRISEAHMTGAEIHYSSIRIDYSSQESWLEKKWMPHWSMMFCGWDTKILSQTLAYLLSELAIKFIGKICIESIE